MRTTLTLDDDLARELAKLARRLGVSFKEVVNDAIRREPGPRHLDILASFAQSGTLVSPLMTDAHIAAIAVEMQATVHSNDTDFDRFPGLRWNNPLATG